MKKQQSYGNSRKIQNFEIFFFLCRIVSSQNFKAYTALERTERPAGGVKNGTNVAKIMENHPNLEL